MGGKSMSRMMRLRSMREPGPGHLWMAVCQHCGHMGAIPVRQLIRRYGELYPIDTVMMTLKCDECGKSRAEPPLCRLCDPGCGRQRG
jgi:hypothetical protein